MKNNDIINELWKLAAPDPNRCNGCEHENDCSMRGCAIIRAAVLEIETLSTENKLLKESKRVRHE